MSTLPLTLSAYTLAEIDRVLARARTIEGAAPTRFDFIQATLNSAIADAIENENSRLDKETRNIKRG